MKILEHGVYYTENKIITCSCGCKFEYETSDIYKDNSLAYTTYPQQIQTYVLCPECNSLLVEKKDTIKCSNCEFEK